MMVSNLAVMVKTERRMAVACSDLLDRDLSNNALWHRHIVSLSEHGWLVGVITRARILVKLFGAVSVQYMNLTCDKIGEPSRSMDGIKNRHVLEPIVTARCAHSSADIDPWLDRRVCRGKCWSSARSMK